MFIQCTVPPKGKLPSSRETRLERNETRLERNETRLARNETRGGKLPLSGTVSFGDFLCVTYLVSLSALEVMAI